MKKKKQQFSKKPETKEEKLTLSHMLNADVLNQLKNKQYELAKDEEEKKAEAERKKREARKRAEKNKTFEQLLSEDTSDWRNFK